MAELGNANLPLNFEVKKKAPIDRRNLVNSVDELYVSDTWTSNDGESYIYNGLTVSVADTGDVYTLINSNDPTSQSSWKKQGSDISEIDGGEFD